MFLFFFSFVPFFITKKTSYFFISHFSSVCINTTLQSQHIHPRIRITDISKHIKPSQEFNRVFTYIASCLGVIIPKPIITQLNLTIIVLSLVFKRTLEVLFGKALSGVAIKVLLAFPYQFAFLSIKLGKTTNTLNF